MLDLYRFELKKLLSRKLPWLAAAAFLVGMAVFGVATEVRPMAGDLTGGETIALEQTGSWELAGQRIDQDLLDRLLPLFTEPTWEDIQAQVRYNDFFNWLVLVLGTASRQELMQTDETHLYESLWASLVPDPQAAGLTQAEIAHWTEQAQTLLAQPLRYPGYHEGWQTAAHGAEVLVFVEILFLALAMAPLFPMERLQRTDQLILSSRFGRGKAYAAKILAGVTVGVAFTLLMSLWYLGILGMLYGWEGFSAPLLFTRLFPVELSVGQGVLVLFAAALVSAVLVSVVVMVLSQLTRSPIAAMAVVLAILLVTTVIQSVPENYRWLAALWYLLPSAFLSLDGAFRYPLLTLGDTAFTTWQVTPVVWLLLSLVIALAGWRFYRRCQVEGR